MANRPIYVALAVTREGTRDILLEDLAQPAQTTTLTSPNPLNMRSGSVAGPPPTPGNSSGSIHLRRIAELHLGSGPLDGCTTVRPAGGAVDALAGCPDL